MEIRMRETGKVVTDSEFRAMFSNTGFPVQLTESIINDFGGDVVFEGPQATTTPPYEFSYRNGVEQIDGKWYTKYSVGPVFTDNEQGTAAEQEASYKAQKDAEQAKSLRQQRNTKLSECDWTQLGDSPVDKAVWATYRQELRDLTKQSGFPWNITWPTAPGA